MISNAYLIRQSFEGYHCDSDIVILHGGLLEITLTVHLNGD